MSVTIEIDYGTHKCSETWEPSNYHCPSCGRNDDTWDETGLGDYYMGNPSMCVKCEYIFYIPLAHTVASDDSEKQVLAVLKRAKPPARRRPR